MGVAISPRVWHVTHLGAWVLEVSTPITVRAACSCCSYAHLQARSFNSRYMVDVTTVNPCTSAVSRGMYDLCATLTTSM